MPKLIPREKDCGNWVLFESEALIGQPDPDFNQAAKRVLKKNMIKNGEYCKELQGPVAGSDPKL